jgi:hypothetical protein
MQTREKIAVAGATERVGRATAESEARRGSIPGDANLADWRELL